MKVFVIGLDGATFNLILPWIRSGRLPHVFKLIEEGAWGSLESTYPPLTAPAWSSFMTGKSPGFHGVFEFFQKEKYSYRQHLASRLDIDGLSLWKILSDAGKKVGVINVPLTYPPEAVNGFLIPGLLTPRRAKDFAYPSSIVKELEEKVGPYRLHHDEKYVRGDAINLLTEQCEILEYRTRSALYLMKNKPWDFFMVHYYGTDRIQHEFWHLLDTGHPSFDLGEFKRHGNVILHFFEKLDEDIGRLLTETDQDTVMMLMSDHGFGRVDKFFNVNPWLMEMGFLKLNFNGFTKLKYNLFKRGFNYSSVAKWILRTGLRKKAIQAGRGRRQRLQESLFLSLLDVDWSETRAYSMGNFGQIFINLKGREPEGCVEPGREYEETLEAIRNGLLSLYDPEDGKKVISHVFFGKDLYDGPYAGRGPDIFFLTRNMIYKPFGLADFASPAVFERVYGCTGHHRPNGIVIIFGDGILKGFEISGAKIEDLAPTILYILGVSVPRDMNGHVLKSAFTGKFLQEHPISYQKSKSTGILEEKKAYTEAEEEDIKRSLKNLGYI